MIVYGAAVGDIGATPAPMTPAISKQPFTARPRRETRCVCFLMTQARLGTGDGGHAAAAAACLGGLGKLCNWS